MSRLAYATARHLGHLSAPGVASRVVWHHAMQPLSSEAGGSSSCWVHEVTPRDGLQNESALLSTKDKVALVEQLAAAGADSIEVTSFVKASLVPALADGPKQGSIVGVWLDRVVDAHGPPTTMHALS